MATSKPRTWSTKLQDLAGDKYGKLTVIKRAPSAASGHKYWLCQCECGKRKAVAATALRTGDTRSCGQCRVNLPAEHHEMRSIWKNMIRRCTKPYSSAYGNYGARGIAVCERWSRSFDAFAEDMGNRPSPDHSIDRINNDGNYEPNNCRWATQKEQMRNTRVNRFLVIEGVRKTIAEWADDSPVPRKIVYQRIAAGWKPKEALERPVDLKFSNRGRQPR